MSINKKAKSWKTQTGEIKIEKLQKLEKIKKLNKNDCHKKQIKNVLDDASAELANLNNMIGSIIGNGRRPTCRGRYEFTTRKYYAKIRIFYKMQVQCKYYAELLREYYTFQAEAMMRRYRQIDCSEFIVQSC